MEDARKAAAEFEREQKRRDADRRREEAAREKEREHQERSESLNAERAAIEKRIEAEDAKWASEREKLKRALRSARA